MERKCRRLDRSSRRPPRRPPPQFRWHRMCFARSLRREIYHAYGCARAQAEPDDRGDDVGLVVLAYSGPW